MVQCPIRSAECEQQAGSVMNPLSLTGCAVAAAPPTPALNLQQQCVAALGQALEPERTSGGTAAVLGNQPSAYRLVVGPDQLDLARGGRLADAGRRAFADGDARLASDLLGAA